MTLMMINTFNYMLYIIYLLHLLDNCIPYLTLMLNILLKYIAIDTLFDIILKS